MGKNDAQNKLTSPFWMIKHIQYPSIGCSQKKTKDILSQKFRINSFTLYNCHLSMTGPKMDLFFSCHKFPPPPKKKKHTFWKTSQTSTKNPPFFWDIPDIPFNFGISPKLPFKRLLPNKEPGVLLQSGARILIFFVIIQGFGAISRWTALINSIVLSVAWNDRKGPEGGKVVGFFQEGMECPPRFSKGEGARLNPEEIYTSTRKPMGFSEDMFF